MTKQILLISSFALVALTSCGPAADEQDAQPYAIPASDSEALLQGLTEFEQHAEAVRIRANAGLFADAAIYGKAVAWALRHPEEFYTADYTQNAYKALEVAEQRLTALEGGTTPWAHDKGYVVRAYRSRVDGSLQPYGLLIPESDNGEPVRLDVWLHGRGGTLTEVSFIAAHDPAFPHDDALSVPGSQNYIQLDVFGRTNNAYRWAGETDVYEALNDVRPNYNIDPDRITLRGFSMGGAGAWHIGLHDPSAWAAVVGGGGVNGTGAGGNPGGGPAVEGGAGGRVGG
jgi:hypothetical protein